MYLQTHTKDNQERNNLRKFASVKHLLTGETYNKVNENNALIVDICCCGSIIAVLFRLEVCSDKY